MGLIGVFGFDLELGLGRGAVVSNVLCSECEEYC